MKVFLSHSRKDKESFVDIVSSKLNSDNIIIDSKSFTPANLNDFEMARLIHQCDIFCLFISNNSLPLNGNLKREKNLFKDELKKNQKIFMPFIIENNIKYKDPRIPKWFRDYNLRPVCKPSKVAALIQEKIEEQILSNNIFLREKSSIFVGRNEQVELFENRYYDIHEGHPICYFISGFEGIGRRTFIKFCLKKVQKVRNNYIFPTINMDPTDSIEDFIAKINDLGIVPDQSIENLLSLSIDEKTSISSSLIKNFESNEDVVLIIDNGAIVKHTGQLSTWFKETINKLDNDNLGVHLVICTKFRINESSKKYYSFSLPELSPKEISRLLIEYMRLFKCDLNTEEIELCLNWLQGFPYQVYFLVEYIKKYSFAETKNNSNRIVNYSLTRAESILAEYKEEEWKIEFIATLAKIELSSISTLKKIFDNNHDYNSLINDLILKNICTLEGISGEYIRLSQIISDYIIRKMIRHSESAFNNLKNIIKQEIASASSALIDLPSIYLSMKELILNGEDLNNTLIFPSHLAKCMKDIYISRKDDSQVIKIAEYIISKQQTISSEMVNIARYYLCLALARKKDKRVLSEVGHLEKIDQLFIKGFFYRRSHEYIKAIDNLRDCLDKKNNYERAKSELVTCYIRTGNLDAAFDLAKECYYSNEYNIYFAQSYFDCLLHKFSKNSCNNTDAIKDEIKKVLSIQQIENKRDSSIYATMKSKYFLFIEHDFEKAFEALNNHIIRFNHDFFTKNAEFSIYEKMNDVDNMKKIHNELLGLISDKQQYDDIIKSNRIRIIAKEYGTSEALKEIENLPNSFSDDFKVRLADKIKHSLYIC